MDKNSPISRELRAELHKIVYHAITFEKDEEWLREQLYKECRKSIYVQLKAVKLAPVIQAFVDFWAL